MRLTFRSKNELAHDTLRQAILQGDLEPGARIVIDELADQLGVSQIPIREALRQLEADGFVVIEPYVGATVTQVDADFIFEVFALLEAMEIIASRAACQRMSAADLETMSALIEAMDSSVGDPDQWSDDNKRLHLFICECANTGLILKMTQKTLDHWDRLRLHYLPDVFAHRIQIAQAEHHQILDAFRARDPDEAERKIREHNQRALASYIHHLQTAGYIKMTTSP